MDKTDRADRDENDIGRLLRAVGPREELPAELKQQWEDHFRGELNQVQSDRRWRRLRLAGGIAAAVVIGIGALLLMPGGAQQQMPAITVSAAGGSSVVTSSSGSSSKPAPGQSIPLGSAIATGQDGHIALAYGGYDLRINRDTLIEFTGDALILRRGEIYASDDERRMGQFQLHIETPQGRVRDIGTQFTVSVQPGSTMATVRRGSIEIDTGTGEFRARAEPGSARRLTVDDSLRVQEERVAASGRGWQWIYQASPAYTLEGRTVWNFLHWSVGQSGLKLVFDSAAAEVHARTTTLHGDIGGMDPEESVTPVLATTDLRAVAGDGVLRVSLR